MENADFFPIKPVDYGRFLVISLGTGSNKREERFSAEESGKWGLLGWLYNKGTTPIIDIFSQASADMVDIHASVLFQALHSEQHYLRIQVRRVFALLRDGCIDWFNLARLGSSRRTLWSETRRRWTYRRGRTWRS